jgi:hypothetical protein
MVERKYLICLLAGRMIGEDPGVLSEDLKVLIDQRLEKCCLPLLGSEKDDVQFLDEVLGETMIYVMGQKINRKQRRGN